MERKRVGGRRLANRREGDRSETLAIYALSKFSFVVPVPRQEDFGVIDFRCTLSVRDGVSMLPKATYCVQVKSEGSELGFTSGEIRWISTNLDSPLMVCTVDKQTQTLRIYSCLNLWPALFYRMSPHAIRLVKGHEPSADAAFKHYPGTSADAVADQEGKFDVFLGDPVIAMTVSDIEERAAFVAEVLNAWIKMDHLNVALMRFGRAAACRLHSEGPNQLPTRVSTQVLNRGNLNQHGLLDKACLVLASLRDSYQRCGRPDRALAIGSLIVALESDAATSGGTPMDRLLLE